jgi:hypothetical protein
MAFRAGISERDFWDMTEFSVWQAYRASHETLSRLAYRIAIYNRIQPKHLPQSEDAIFAEAKPKRQTLQQQYMMARTITKVMVH